MKLGSKHVGTESDSEKSDKKICRAKFISYLVLVLPALWMLLAACNGGGGGGGGRQDHQ